MNSFFEKFNIIKLSLVILGAFSLFFVWPHSALATPVAPNILIEFEYKPLFSEVNFLPGNTVTRYVKVTNNTSTPKLIGVKLNSFIDNDNLASQLNVVITQNTATLYIGTLGSLYDNDVTNLSEIASGVQTQYNFAVTFNNSANNNYQNGSVGFDIQVGVSGEGTLFTASTPLLGLITTQSGGGGGTTNNDNSNNNNNNNGSNNNNSNNNNGNNKPPKISGIVSGVVNFSFTHNMWLGMWDNDVKELQKRLTILGFYKGKISTYFSWSIFRAVQAYQRKNGITATGFVGPITRAALNK
jgi:hypothetical protein